MKLLSIPFTLLSIVVVLLSLIGIFKFFKYLNLPKSFYENEKMRTKIRVNKEDEFNEDED